MTEVGKVLYIAVLDEDEKVEKGGTASFRYTHPVLQSTLQLMGCKARHAFKIGSVEEESTKLDEKYDDLAMQDMQENGHLSDDEEDLNEKMVPVTGVLSTNIKGEKYSQNLDSFPGSEQLSETLCFYSSAFTEKNDLQLMPTGNIKVRKRSLSISALGKQGSIASDPTLS